jgi:hypothetical protein
LGSLRPLHLLIRNVQELLRLNHAIIHRQDLSDQLSILLMELLDAPLELIVLFITLNPPTLQLLNLLLLPLYVQLQEDLLLELSLDGLDGGLLVGF